MRFARRKPSAEEGNHDLLSSVGRVTTRCDTMSGRVGRPWCRVSKTVSWT